MLVLLGFTEFRFAVFSVHHVSLGLSLLPSSLVASWSFHWVSLGFTGFYWVLLGFTGFYLVLLGNALCVTAQFTTLPSEFF